MSDALGVARRGGAEDVFPAGHLSDEGAERLAVQEQVCPAQDGSTWDESAAPAGLRLALVVLALVSPVLDKPDAVRFAARSSVVPGPMGELVAR